MDFLRSIWDPLDKWKSECNGNLQTIMVIVQHGELLNQRQCEDLTKKLTMITENVHMIVQRNWYWYQFSLREYYRCLEKAKMLVTKCAEKEWWRAAAFQWQNVNAFQEILLDASLCYNVIYELAKEMKETGLLDDLRQSSVFEPASDSDVREDEEHLISLLGQLIIDPGLIESEHLSCPEEVACARALARFLRNRFVNNKEKDTGIGMMWDDNMEYPGMWGEVRDLKGTGSEFVKAVSTKWLAIPCFRKEFLADEDENIDENVFLKEASIMAHMKHPNIIRFLCHGNGQNPSCRFIGMELMEMSLSKLIEEQGGKPFPLEVAIDIIKQIARGMCYLHDQDVAHRDLKPQNVVIKKWGSPKFEGYCDVKLVDFGISKTEVDDYKSNTIPFYGIGTSKYMAPELHPRAKFYSRNRAKWFKADVYSFAMTCVHVLSLQPPFEELGRKISLDELYSKIMDGTKPNFPRGFERLEELIKECWHVLPYKRPTFVDICSRLQSYPLKWRTIYGVKESSPGFVNKKIVAQSNHYRALPKVLLGETNDEDGNKRVSIISCPYNHNLAHFHKPAYISKRAFCDLCDDRDCVDYMYGEACNWNEAHEKVMMEKESKDVQAQSKLISEILDKMSSYYDSETKSSIYKPPLAINKVHVPIRKPTTPKHNHESLDVVNDVNLQRNIISVQTAKRIKAKKLASKKLRAKPLEILVNLEKIVANLHNIENATDDEKKGLIAVHKRLKERQRLVQEDKVTREELMMCPGPRIAIFFLDVMKDGRWVRQLLIDLQAGMEDVCFGLLCEKPGHEHIVPDKTRMYEKKLGEGIVEYLEPMLACGLQIVRDNITSIEHDLVGLEFISIPNLGADVLWDLSAFNRINGMENMEVLKQAAVYSSEWYLKRNECEGYNIKEEFGLRRIRYKVTDEGNPPCYRNGSLAWLCEKHFDNGLNEGILESYSSKYHNIDDDFEIRYPRYLLENEIQST